MYKKYSVYFFVILRLKGGIKMGRPIGTKNIMRTPKEKEKIILDFKKSGMGTERFSKTIGMSRSLLIKWIKQYEKDGIKALKSKTGKCAKKEVAGRPKKSISREEELERENLKLRIEIERLKKGYYVKGVGAKKEFVSINNRSTKSSKN